MIQANRLHPWYTRLWRLARLDYLKILRTRGAPTQVARGVGYGVFIELIFFPTLGLAFFLMYPANKYLKGHMGASMAGFVFAKLIAFLTIPPSFILGSKILGLPNYKDEFYITDPKTKQERMTGLSETWEVVKELFSTGELFNALDGWTTGAAIFGVVLGIVAFFITRTALRKYQAHGKERREEILREKVEAKG